MPRGRSAPHRAEESLVNAAHEVIEQGMEPAPGYRLRNRLGRGGFGEVWEASAPEGPTVALKFIPCKGKPAHVIANEIRQLLNFRDFRHPHLIQLHNVFATQNFIIICMEKADGTLNDLHRAYLEEQRTHLPADHLLDLLGQAAEALDFMAAQRPVANSMTAAGTQHCDVKPSNLLLLGDCVKVADFGLCGPQRLHSSKKFMGTPPYAAPELYQGRLSPRTDQYALAVTYCELRTGRPPFPALEYAAGRSQTTTPDLSALPPAEQRIVARALDPTWLDRWPTCKAFIDALRGVSGAGACTAHTLTVIPGVSTQIQSPPPI